IIVTVHAQAEADLLHVAHAGGDSRLLPSLREDREEDRRHDGNHDEHQDGETRGNDSGDYEPLVRRSGWPGARYPGTRHLIADAIDIGAGDLVVPRLLLRVPEHPEVAQVEHQPGAELADDLAEQGAPEAR